MHLIKYIWFLHNINNTKLNNKRVALLGNQSQTSGLEGHNPDLRQLKINASWDHPVIMKLSILKNMTWCVQITAGILDEENDAPTWQQSLWSMCDPDLLQS